LCLCGLTYSKHAQNSRDRLVSNLHRLPLGSNLSGPLSSVVVVLLHTSLVVLLSISNSLGILVRGLVVGVKCIVWRLFIRNMMSVSGVKRFGSRGND
jgi:hypothetical protein